MATDNYRAFMDLGKEAGLMGPELTKWVKEQLDDLAKQKKEERLERWNYEVEQRRYEEEKRRYEVEQRPLEDAREEQRRQQELALKESSQALKKSELALKEKELELEIQQASNTTPVAPNGPISSINSLVPKWIEEESEAWLEEIEALFENYNTIEIERALVLAKNMEGKAKAALSSLEKSQRGDMLEVRRVITKAYEITPENWRQQFRGLAKEVNWS
ncbi:IgA receptor-like [Macrobrachium rosenbergii]|uniref:IgA receptor-like n=1 Tax=Macrobrachium rosenbergii TaxID=79674 RepID=UPI0034D5D8CC